MTTKNRTSNATQLAANQALIDGLVKHAATLATLLVAGSTVPTSALVTVLQARIAAIKLTLTTKATFMAAVAAAHAEIANTAALVSGARQALRDRVRGSDRDPRRLRAQAAEGSHAAHDRGEGRGQGQGRGHTSGPSHDGAEGEGEDHRSHGSRRGTGGPAEELTFTRV